MADPANVDNGHDKDDRDRTAFVPIPVADWKPSPNIWENFPLPVPQHLVKEPDGAWLAFTRQTPINQSRAYAFVVGNRYNDAPTVGKTETHRMFNGTRNFGRAQDQGKWWVR